MNPGAPVRLSFDTLECLGFSVSGLATYVMIPAWDLVFDLGHCAFEAAQLRHVFLSHVHQDHAAAVFRHCALRSMQNQKLGRIYVPAESHKALVEVFRAFEAMEGREAMALEKVLQPVRPGEVFSLSRRLRVEVFDVQHRLPSRGYTIFESRSKLRPEYQGLPAIELQAARLRGETLSDTVEHRRLSYVGDSTIETLVKHPELGQSEVLFLEATHLGDTDRATSAKYGHTHLDELAELYRSCPEALASRHIVLKHFSLRYSKPEIRDAVQALPKELLARVTLLL